ncbi:GntR family transcriptional regulator [Elioraea sp. Yellowstone]|jgi:DNA-binding GntR family transcriptional regulator|uniref:GntR family transcriptional regulator n=1 Tax=Elioraea sp. Yellowstone TaxID=2592070 RepID=UPI00114F338E|nr:GntR family transcriptional regulator [Elioraea sp. Yellowstone]TQF77276.1 GntR family transcriptional regulator [Elioraea sp. Yellowstone]
MTASVTVLPVPARPRRTGATKPARVAELIREMIIQDTLPPGAPIRERALAEQLQVSRTPLREALKILAAEGLVEIEPHRGAVVAAPSPTEMRELLQLLGVIEAYAGELAAASATEEEIREITALHYEMLAAYTRGDRLTYFHRNQAIHLALVRATRNRTLVAHHGRINARVYRARYISNLETQRWEKAIEEHEAILAALQRRDGAGLAAILREHVLRGWDETQILLAAQVAS